MNLAPLYSYLDVMNGRYAVALIGLAVLLSFLLEYLARSRKAPFLVHVVVNAAGLSVTFLTLCFLIFISYGAPAGSEFDFLPLAFSTFIVLLVFTVSGLLMLSWQRADKLHPVVFVLAVLASAVASPLLAGAVKIAHRFSLFWNPFAS